MFVVYHGLIKKVFELYFLNSLCMHTLNNISGTQYIVCLLLISSQAYTAHKWIEFFACEHTISLTYIAVVDGVAEGSGI